MPAAFDWSGFYLGATIGGQFTTGDMDMYDNLNPPGERNIFYSTDLSSNDLIAGIIAGYNHQFGNGVIGLEGDFNWANTGSRAVSGSPNLPLSEYRANNDLSEDFNAHIRARAGYAMDRTLIFASAGVAITRSELDIHTICEGDDYKNNPDTETRFGLSISGGAEYAFNDNLIGRLEYVADFYGDDHFDEQGYYSQRDISSFTQQTARVGISYLFK